MAARRTKLPPHPFMKLLGTVAPLVDRRLSEVLAASEARAASYGPETAAMVASVRHLCERGGKRLRPGLCVVGALCHDEAFDVSLGVEAGVSLELLQAYFLIHDDWMDQDATRRGGPSSHVELARRFRSKALGERSAILAGDHAVALAQAHLTTLATPPARLKRCMERFAEMQLAAVFGQQLDLIGKVSDPELTYELKTASYTVSGPLLLGADLAGAKPGLIRALTGYATPAGIAFQLRDDIVGSFGTSKITGKPQGGDLKEGKNTTLVREARRRLRGRDWAAFRAVLGNRRATVTQVRVALRILDECGARAAVETRIEELISEARSHLKSTSMTTQGQRLLEGAVFALARRRS